MDLSMFEDLPDVQGFLNKQGSPGGIVDILDTMNSSSTKSKPADINQRPNRNGFPKKTPIAMAYVPMQEWDKTFDTEKGFKRGTVFPDLDLPFAPEEGCYDT